MLRRTTVRRGRGWRPIFCLLLLLQLSSYSFASTAPQVDDSSLFREGEVFLSKGETEKALWRFRSLLTDFPKSSLYNEAKFRMAICYTRLKRPKDAIRTLNELFSTFLSPARMVEVFTLLGDNHMELKDPVAALQWYGKGLLVAGQPQEDLKKQVRSIIDLFDTEEKLAQIESLYRGAYAGGYAKLKLVQLAKRRGNDALSKTLLADLDKEYRAFNFGPQAKEAFGPTAIAEKSKYVLGVVLPLTGTYSHFGDKALKAIQLAIKEYDAPGRPPLISLAVRDSKGDPAEAEKAVEELVSQEKVIAVIGALLSSTVERVARKCEMLKVPLISLSQKEPLGVKGDFIFQNSLTPTSQVEALANFAFRELELRTFGVFYPNSPYGHNFKDLFTKEISRRGGKIAGSVAYQENQINLSQEIKTFFRIKSNPKGEDAPSLPLDGLFVPDTYDHAGQVMAQIDYYNVRGVTFLGTNAWNDPKLPAAGGKISEGSIFVDAFSAANPSPATVHFVKEFRKVYPGEPDTLDALSYEAAALLRDILRSKPVASPAQLKDEIHRIQDFQGPCGLRGFDEEGKMLRTLSILRINNGRIEHFAP